MSTFNYSRPMDVACCCCCCARCPCCQQKPSSRVQQSPSYSIVGKTLRCVLQCTVSRSCQPVESQWRPREDAQNETDLSLRRSNACHLFVRPCGVPASQPAGVSTCTHACCLLLPAGGALLLLWLHRYPRKVQVRHRHTRPPPNHPYFRPRPRWHPC